MIYPSRSKLILGFFVICMLWGSSWAAVKISLESVPIFLSLALRFLTASLLFGVIYFSFHKNMSTDRKFWRLIIILSVTSFILPFILVYWAQTQINSGLASILFATFPIWVAIISHYLLPNEKIKYFHLIGIVVGFCGIVIIFNDGLNNLSFNSLLGMHGIILSAIFQAFGLVALRKYGKDYSIIALNLFPMIISSIFFAGISFLFENISIVRFTLPSIISIAYLALFSSVLAFLIYFWLVKYVEVVILSLSAFITPLIAILIAIIIINEIFSINMFIGSLFVLLGVALAILGNLFSTIKIHKLFS